MDVGAVITRLRAQCPAFGNRIFGAAELGQAQDDYTVAQPAAYVLTIANASDEQQTAFGLHDRFDETIDVLVSLDASDDADTRGQASMVEVDALRDELRAALVGWPVDADHRGFVYLGGDLREFTRELLWHGFQFESVRRAGRIVSYQIDGRLIVGADRAAWYAQIEADILGVLTKADKARVSSDLDTTLEVIPQDSQRFSLVATPSPHIRSNATLNAMNYQLIVHTHLSAAEAERDYTEGGMGTETVALLLPAFWHAGLNDADDFETDDSGRPALTFPADLL